MAADLEEYFEHCTQKATECREAADTLSRITETGEAASLRAAADIWERMAATTGDMLAWQQEVAR